MCVRIQTFGNRCVCAFRRLVTDVCAPSVEPWSDSPTVDSDSARQLSDSPTVPTVRQSDSCPTVSDSICSGPIIVCRQMARQCFRQFRQLGSWARADGSRKRADQGRQFRQFYHFPTVSNSFKNVDLVNSLGLTRINLARMSTLSTTFAKMLRRSRIYSPSTHHCCG